MNFKTSFRNILYPGILVIIIAATVVSALLTIRFLTTNINAAFEVNESALESSTIKIDMEGYKLAAKKLGIPYPAAVVPPTPPPPETEEQ